MAARLIPVIVAACVAAIFLGEITAQQQPAQGGQPQQLHPCSQTFLNSLSQCVQNNSLNVQSFLYVVSNASQGTVPPDAFKSEMCGKQTPLMQCGMNFMRQLINASICLPQPAQGGQAARPDQRPIIDSQFRSIAFTLDQYCAHPCRQTLANDMRQCYSEAGLDPALFLSNSSTARGAVIGTTQTQVAQFCTNKQALVTCMKQKRDACPDAPIVMQAMGLDIESMDKGISVLCNHQPVYLTGIDCFAEPTADVTRCLQVQAQEMMASMQQAQAESWNETRFFQAFCRIRMSHVVCDVGAWKAKMSASCNPAVIGLRTELECELMPDDCVPLNKQTFDQTCQAQNYKREERLNYGSAGTASLALSAVLAAFIGWAVQL